MYSFILLAVAVLCTAAAVSPQSSNSSIQCVKGLKMFVSRGTGEAMGSGVTGNVTEAIARLIKGSNYEPILYPASAENPDYFVSVRNGTQLLKQKVTEYAAACPDSKIALFGYSQGAQITSNNLCGTPAIWAGFDLTSTIPLSKILQAAEPLPKNITENIVAAVLFGDPTHEYNATYNYGNATGSGDFHRFDTGICEELGDRIRSYCDNGDPFCDVGEAVDPSAHLNYVQVYGEDVVQYVVDQYNNGGKSGAGSSSGTGGNATATTVPVNGADARRAPIALLIASCLLVLRMI